MNTKIALLFFLCSMYVLMGSEKVLVLQNGLNGYSGFETTYISNLSPQDNFYDDDYIALIDCPS
ncbi:MAG: hypothetical protein ACQEQ4_03800 [Fibrobacterota bacterium]|jgi:hypothetical protein